MKKQDVRIDTTYLAKVSGAVVPVTIVQERWIGNDHKGWIGKNTETGRSVVIKSAQRLRAVAGATPSATKVEPPVAPVAGDVGDGGAGSEPVAVSAKAASPVPPKGAKGGKGKAKQAAKVRAIASADQENARARDERAASKDGMTASERAMARSAKGKGKTAKAAKPAKAPKAAKAKKDRPMSGLDAAAKVLADSKEPMKVKDIVAVAAKKGLWKSADGKTPEATIYAAIVREIFNKQGESRFVKKDRGLFAAAGK